MSKEEMVAWRSFERGSRACLGQELAMMEMKMVLVCTVQWFDFECYNGEARRGLGNKGKREEDGEGKKARLGQHGWCWTKMDEVFGDRAFQEGFTEARPRDGMMMTVRRATSH